MATDFALEPLASTIHPSGSMMTQSLDATPPGVIQCKLSNPARKSLRLPTAVDTNASSQTLLRRILESLTVVGPGLAIAATGVGAGDLVAAAAVPSESTGYLLGVSGGVTLLSYGYGMRERGWTGAARLSAVRVDLTVAYSLTGLFGVAVVVLAAHTLHATGTPVAGTDSALVMARMLETALGGGGRWAFLIGFWAAVATSMLGVWQGVPYLFCDFVSLVRRQSSAQRAHTLSTRSAWYRGYLAWLALPPIALLYLNKPVAVVVVYAIFGALFMPFLAATLLYLGTGRVAARTNFHNGWPSVAGLLLCILLFGSLALRRFGSLW